MTKTEKHDPIRILQAAAVHVWESAPQISADVLVTFQLLRDAMDRVRAERS